MNCSRENALKNRNDEENKQTAQLMGFMAFQHTLTPFPTVLSTITKGSPQVGNLSNFSCRYKLSNYIMFIDSENEKQTSGSRVSAESVILSLKGFHFAEVIKM